MKREYSKSSVRRRMYKELDVLMKKAEQDIFDGNGQSYYNSSTHYYLMQNAWEIMFPLGREKWPDIFNEYIADKNLPWPQGSTYSYVMSSICPPYISSYSIYFGYAIVEGKLIRTTFLAIETIAKYQIMPQAMVIDPLCIAHGIEPEYYIGCLAEKEDIQNFMIKRKNPLEMFVERKNKKEHEERIFNSYMEAYNLQMAYEPGWFPQQLIDFAKRENLYVPKQDRDDTFLGDEDEPKNRLIPKRNSGERSKKIFLLRHAIYSNEKKDPGLSEDGKIQAQKLASKIQATLEGDSAEDFTIWTSPANRAKETAMVIKENLCCSNYFEKEKLWCDKDHDHDFGWLKYELDNFEGEVLIIVSHLEYVTEFPEELGFPGNRASYARGVLIQDGKCINFP